MKFQSSIHNFIDIWMLDRKDWRVAVHGALQVPIFLIPKVIALNPHETF